MMNKNVAASTATILAFALAIGCGSASTDNAAESGSAASIAEQTECIDFNESCQVGDNSFSCSGTWGSYAVSCDDLEAMTNCTYTDNVREVPDVCANTPRYWEDEEYAYSETCETISECSSPTGELVTAGDLALADTSIRPAATADGGGGGALTRIKACVDKCKKAAACILLCWGLGGVVAPPAGGGAKPPPQPPNIAGRINKAKEELEKRLKFGKNKKAIPGADAGTTGPAMPARR